MLSVRPFNIFAPLAYACRVAKEVRALKNIVCTASLWKRKRSNGPVKSCFAWACQSMMTLIWREKERTPGTNRIPHAMPHTSHLVDLLRVKTAFYDLCGHVLVMLMLKRSFALMALSEMVLYLPFQVI